ncbi:hypothetical protein D3C80_2185010 [compost metagenome]
MTQSVDMRSEDAGRDIQSQLRQQVIAERIADAVRADGISSIPGEQEAGTRAGITSGLA